jgi:hypothetical protein
MDMREHVTHECRPREGGDLYSRVVVVDPRFRGDDSR